MRVRLEDVAAHAAVSVATVSRVLGEREPVAAQTRDRVQRALTELGYSRSTLLARQQVRMVAVAAPVNPEAWQSVVCRQVATTLQGEGLLVAAPSSGEGLHEVHSTVAAGAVAVITPTFTPLAVDVPVIRFDEHPGPNTNQFDRIAAGLDLAAGITLAFDHLRAIGHRRIGLICNDAGELAAQLRTRFLAEHPMRNLGGRMDEWVAPVPKSWSGGARAALRLKDATCTAVIAQSALHVHGALSALRDRRLVVPRDMSIIGFGDSLTMRFTGPPTTVLRLEPDELAAALVRTARSTLGLPGAGQSSVPPSFRPRLLARASTAVARE